MKMEALSVRDILSTQDIVIPEIQREYVWGNNKQLLEQFIRDITTAGTDINVGFLYSYMPEQASHSTCFLIDGQQRFTTLVLILYYLSIKEKRQACILASLSYLGSISRVKGCLISSCIRISGIPLLHSTRFRREDSVRYYS